MSQVHLKAGAVLFASVSVALLLLSAIRWQRSEPAPAGERPGRGTPGGNLILFMVSAGLAIALWMLAVPLGWELHRAMWLGCGAFLAVLTLARPWWFWDHYRARWLRSLIGDEATAAFYLVLAGIMAWVGLYTDWTFGRQ